jgi:hypothetical protein
MNSATPAGSDARSRRVIWISALVLAVATVLMLARIEPMASWYYALAWYPTIAIADAWAQRRDARTPMLLDRPLVLVALLAWSAVIWFSFELWNLRLQNWYYVNVPDQKLLRWIGTVIAFATVLPGIFAVTQLLGTYAIGERVRTRPFTLSDRALIGLWIAGGVSAALVLLWPRQWFPLVWGATFFLIAPLNYHWGGRSLLREVAGGRWGLVIRLLLGGAICGLLWELFNFQARTKWIYTVPGLTDWKLFEMPVLGFLGFPPFALECYEMYRALVNLELAPEWETIPRSERGRGPASVLVRAGVVAGAIAIVAAGLPLVDRYTVDSFTPRPRDLPAVDAELAAQLAARGVKDVARMPAVLADSTGAAGFGIDPARRERLQGQVALALLRGIGAPNAGRLAAVGIDDPAELALTDDVALAKWLHTADPAYKPHPERLQVWVRAARRGR